MIINSGYVVPVSFSNDSIKLWSFLEDLLSSTACALTWLYKLSILFLTRSKSYECFPSSSMHMVSRFICYIQVQVKHLWNHILTYLVVLRTGNRLNASDTGGQSSKIHFLLARYVVFIACLTYLLLGRSSCNVCSSFSISSTSSSDRSISQWSVRLRLAEGTFWCVAATSLFMCSLLSGGIR